MVHITFEVSLSKFRFKSLLFFACRGGGGRILMTDVSVENVFSQDIPKKVGCA